MHRVRVVDGTTEGEPIRVVIAGGPDLGPGGAAERLQRLSQRFDHFRAGLCNSATGSPATVGALLLPASRPQVTAQVVFFNNVGYLGMCGHGAIGVAETLRQLGRIGPGRDHVFETPVGDVKVDLRADGTIAVENIPSFRHAKDVAADTVRNGTVVGDVAWGGNWFFLIRDHGQELDLQHRSALTCYTRDVRRSLGACGITGANDAEIDHVVLFGRPSRADADSKNFVLCPGLEYDRSPCGTGTSAKLACLIADGELADGAFWRQESITGSRFVGTARRAGRGVIPTIAGRASVAAERTLWLHSGSKEGCGR